MSEEDPQEGGTERRSQDHWIGIGLALGAAIGLLLDNLAVGIALGLVLGVGMSHSERRPGDDHGPEDSDTDSTKGPASD